MLRPQDRQLLLDALRPPQGYELCRAIGTTFTLDLLTLLTAPVAFTLFEEERQRFDPLSLLHTMRCYADRIRVFCQAGRIKIPTGHRLLYSYLEESVFEVTLPDENGVFHPKVWVLRYRADGKPTRYRLLVLSRNLTFDRSWDTALVLEGTYTERQYRYSLNYPLGDFLGALPEMTLPRLREQVEQVKEELDEIIYEIQRVEWELPRPFKEIKFWALGLPHKRNKWPFEGRIDRFLVVSPFLSEGLINSLAERGEENILISRIEEIEHSPPKTFSQFDSVYAFSPDVTMDENTPNGEDGSLSEVPLTGLHAKLFLAERGWDARLWTGSANATNAAFNNNVEFLVELHGRKSKIGIDALLESGREGSVSFADLLAMVSKPEEAAEADSVQDRLEKCLRAVREKIVRAGFELFVRQVHDERYRLMLDPGEIDFSLLDAKVRCWPITLDESKAITLQGEKTKPISIGECSLEALTSFVAFEVKAVEAEETLAVRFVLNVPLHDAPEKRDERVLMAMLKDRDQVMRYLLMMLIDDGTEAADAFAAVRSPGETQFYNADGQLGIPMLETLMRTLTRDPAKLDQVNRLVEDLRKTPEGIQLLPDGFDAIWEPIWQARLRMLEDA